MNTWLVLLCHSMDDFPIRLFPSYEAAKGFVDANPITETENGEWAAGPEVMEAYQLARIDASTPLGYKIWHFKDSAPTGWETVGWIG